MHTDLFKSGGSGDIAPWQVRCVENIFINSP